MSSSYRRLPRLACVHARMLQRGQRRCAHIVENHQKASRESGVVETARWKGTFAPRHGKAVEPGVWEKTQQQQQQEIAEEEEEADEEELEAEEAARAGVVTIGGTRYTTQTASDTAKQTQPPTDQEVPRTTTTGTAAVGASDAKPVEIGATHSSSSTESSTTSTPSSSSSSSSSSASQQPQSEATTIRPNPADVASKRPLEAVLHMPTPEEGGLIPHKHPHLSPPRYVHHFDTYSLVNQLVAGTYTQPQAITVMKGVRAILAHNLDVATSNLVSKSDVENESYLFRAACSELSTEIYNNRRLSDEQMRQQRTHLQHEVDILTQNLNQELATLHDNVRGMFNDRKMAVSEEQKAVESAVQQISYKISIMLSSDAKSEIEAVRWILIRRSVAGILFMAVLTLGTLRYATYVNQEKKREAEKAKVEKEVLRRDGGRNDQASAPDAALILSAN